MKMWWLRWAAITLILFSAKLYGNPLLGLVDPNCFVVNNDICPNENVTFWLYTNSTSEAPIKLDPLNLNPWDFQPPRELKFLIHGYTGYRDFAPNTQIRPALLAYDDVYVISIDYAPLVRAPCYVHAVQNVPLVSKCVAQLINTLIDQGIVQNEQIHVIGFSLGGQVAGQTANHVKRKLKRITGLDPAKPLFIFGSSNRRLDADDAEFVDVIHTDVLGRGMLRPMGHVDFYPNMGPVQPGCMQENMQDPGSCNHERAPLFYAESIHSKVGFWAYRCTNWLFQIFGLCPANNEELTLMGYHVNSSLRGSYFLKTAAGPVYALGKASFHDNVDEAYKFNLITMDQEIADNFEPQLQRAFLEVEDNHIDDYNDLMQELD